MSQKIVPLRTRSSMAKAADVYGKLMVMGTARAFTPEDTETLIAMMLASRMMQVESKGDDEAALGVKRHQVVEALESLANLMLETGVIIPDDDPPEAV